jgi:hypothetical protein
MTDEQKQKIRDVMHTLSFVRDGKALNPRASAKACHDVLQEVLDLSELKR